MSNNERVEKSMRFAEKRIGELNGIPGHWLNYPPESTKYVLTFSLVGEEKTACFTLSDLEDNKDFETWICNQILQRDVGNDTVTGSRHGT